MREIAIVIAALALAGGAVWLLADGGDAEPAAEVAQSPAPDPPPAAPSAPSNDTEGGDSRADRDTDQRNERGSRARDDHARADATGDEPDKKASGSSPAEQTQPDRRSVNEIVENLLGGKPDRSPSQADLPPELGALLQGGGDPEPSKPAPTLEELLDEASGGG